MTKREAELVEALKLAQDAWTIERNMYRNLIAVLAEEKWREYCKNVLGIELRKKEGA